MNTPETTRERLICCAADLFAERGFRGASVRDICDLARANPGAVSYHFGGKRQLYRTVMRQAAVRLTVTALPQQPGDATPTVADLVTRAVLLILYRMESDPVPGRLVLRDLAEGGGVAVEALAPVVRSAFDALCTATGHEDDPRGVAAVRTILLEHAAPVFLLTAGWPVIERVFELALSDRETLLRELLERVHNRR